MTLAKARSHEPDAPAVCASMKMLYTQWQSPLGELLLAGEEGALAALHLPGRRRVRDDWIRAVGPFAQAIRQLEEYFAGERTAFDLKLAPGGGGFDRAVWEHLVTIPYGETRSYAQIARDIGRPDRARAVGGANARNPLPIIVPCHRVVGTDGSLTGYGGGLAMKRALLVLERGQRRLL
jgi:methylated-DNA-[protein]-cysteine S-methyltransferase